jgi:hypothetical protein
MVARPHGARRRRFLGVALLVCVGTVTSCSDADGDPGQATATSTTGAVATTAGASDDATELQRLGDRIVDAHPDPFHHVSEAEFDAAAAVEPADDDELLVAAMRLANLGAGEGHGGVYPWDQPALEAWPIHLYDFPEGLRVVGGTGAPIGAALVEVGGVPVAEVRELLRPLVPHDTESTIRSRLPAYLVFPAVLRGLGFDPSTLTWESVDGEISTGPAPETITSEAFAELLGLFQAQVPPTLPYDRDRLFWSERRRDATYVRWNQVQPRDAGVSLTELGNALVADVEGGVTRVVIDARHNPGGEIPSAKGLEDAVREIEAMRPGTVRFLVGRGTFSAASFVIARLVAETGVQVVGEPTGGSSRSYSDPRLVESPESGIRVFVNTRLYESGEADWGPVQPDVEEQTTWADWQAGRDPVLDAALG